MIKLKNIIKNYQAGPLKVEALRGVDLEIQKGEFVSIIGPSGAGKSTLLHILGCLDRPTSGQYIFGDRAVEHLSDDDLAVLRSRKIGFVFQSFGLFPHITVLRNLELPMAFANIGTPATRKKAAMEMLGEIGLPDKARFTPMEISGGQQQKVAIARALINKPDVVFADEPTGNLDSASSKKVLDLIRELNQRGVTIVLVTHDEHIAEQAKRIVSVYDGKIVDDKVL